MIAPSKRILVVDDEEDVVEALQYTIEDQGYEVVTALTADDALAKVADGPFDAAVLDFATGEIHALEIAHRLRDNPETSHLPIIVLSDVEESAVREQFSGYDLLFVCKETDLDKLAQQLALLIGEASGSKVEQHPSS